MEATATPTASARRLDIQGLRAVAVLAVVAFHARLPVSGGFVGVDMFFVISGFVITSMLMREWSSLGRIRLGRFYVRRFKRLTPALALVLSVTMVIGFFVLSPLGTQQDAARTAIGATALAANFVIAKLTGDYFGLDAESNALLNTWSLSVEEQFYLIFPALLFVSWLLARRTGKRWFPIAMLSLVGLISFGLTLLGSSGYVLPVEGWLLGFYSPFTRVWEFAVGALLALAGERAMVRTTTGASAFGFAGVLMLTASLFLFDGSTVFPGVATLLPVFGTLGLLLAGTFRAGAAYRVLSTPPMVRIGDWSYSIYLWHWPLIVFATLLWPDTGWAALLAALVSFLPAIASYRWLETPFRTRATPHARQLIAMVLAVLAPPLVLSVGLWQGAAQGFWQPKVQQFQQQVFAQPEGCSRFTALTVDNAADCTWNADESGRPIYLFGDSNAGHFVDAVVQAGKELGRPIVVTTTNSCPFIDVHLDRLSKPSSWDAECRDFVQGTLDYLRGPAAAGTVIISNADGYWDEGDYAIGTSTEMLSTEQQTKLHALSAGLTNMVTSLQDYGHEVVVAQTIPRWSGEDTWRTDSCTMWSIAADSCEQTMPLERALQRQGAVRGVVASVATDSGARVFDPWPILCPGSTCHTNNPEGYPRYYRDGLHVSVRQGRAMTSDFVALLSPSASPLS